MNSTLIDLPDESSRRVFASCSLCAPGSFGTELKNAVAFATTDFRPDLKSFDGVPTSGAGTDFTGVEADPDTAGVPIILLTARAQESDIEQGFEAGADDYIVKPFSPRELASRVSAVLARATR